ncbi:MAG: STAS domain-containing protein [Acidobacteriota bacterium]
MKIDVRQKDEIIILDVQGRFVTTAAKEIFGKSMDQVIADGWKKVLLDLTGVEWIDSRGIGELVSTLRMAKKFGVAVKLLRVGDRVKHVLSISQILPLLDIYEIEEEAIAALKSATVADDDLKLT